MWEAIELREIRVFVALAEELHFGRAAERLGLTQSRVSQSLRTLETKLGDELVHRTSRRVALTFAGERFLARVGPPYAALTGVLERTHDSSRRLEGRLRLGLIAAGASGTDLLRVVKTFEAQHAACEVVFVQLPFRDRMAPLRASEVDVVVARLPLNQPDLTVGPIVTRDSRVLAVARDHPLAQRASVSIEDLPDYDVGWIDVLVRETAEAYIPPQTPSGRTISRRALAVDDVSDALLTIARSRVVLPTVSSFASAFAHPDIAYIPIRDMPVSETALVWRRRRRDARLREFVRLARGELARG